MSWARGELGTVGSGHVPAGWQSRWGWLHPAVGALPGVLWQTGYRLEAEVALLSLPAHVSGPSLCGS